MAKKVEVTPLKCAIYMRYSTKNQGKTSIAFQRSAIKKFIKSKKWELHKIFVDEGFSGKHERRPAFQDMLTEGLRNRGKAEWDVLLIHDLSRFARNLEIATVRKRELRDKGYLVISVTEPCTERDPGGSEEQFADLMNAAVSNVVSYKTRLSLATRAKRAMHCGGTPPLGFNIRKKKLVVNPREAEVVKEIFDMYRVGMSYQQMADSLNERGITTKAKREFTVNSFIEILRQQKYIGRYVWNRRIAVYRDGRRHSRVEKPVEEHIIVEGGCPQIIEKEVFDEVQQLLQERKTGHIDSKSRRTYMLGGLRLLKCGNCGRYMTGQVTKSHGKEYLVYRCPNHIAKKCDTKDISQYHLNEYVAKIITGRYFAVSNIPTLNKLMKGKQDTEKRRRENISYRYICDR